MPMDDNLKHIKIAIYDHCTLEISDFQYEKESQEYDACQFVLNGRKIKCRNAKTTPKEAGQFITFWKRNGKAPIEPFNKSDPIDFFIVNVRIEKEFGQFVFPKSVLIQKGIISTESKDGKRAFQVYPSWDIVGSKQAERTQKWQLDYFYLINAETDLKRVRQLYQVR